MASDDSQDKTEQPTERRRHQAREEGNLARSVDVNASAVLLGASSALYFLGPASGEALLGLMRSTLTSEAWIVADRSQILRMTWICAGAAAAAALPIMAVTALSAFVAVASQVGFLWAPDVLQLKWNRLDPIQGFQRICSLSSVVRLAGGLIKIMAVAAVAWWYLSSRQDEFLNLSQQNEASLLVILGGAIIELGFYLALTLVGLAILDYGYQFWQHERDLRMTKQEIRDEMKDMDGNPHVRARRRDAHRKLAQGRELQAVKTADFVLTNPTEIAVAIKYDPVTMPAPTVVAKGMGEIAAQIRRLAAEHGIPIIERKPLARALYRDVKVGHPVPVEMYQVFIEILAYVYRITGRKPPVN